MSLAPDMTQVLDRPLLVVGAPRSGTTWVQRILLSHPAIRGGQESEFFATFGPALRVFHNTGTRHRYIGLDNYWTEEALRQEIRTLWHKTMRNMVEEPGVDLLVEKSPDHALYMDDIVRILPQAKFIHVIRDSRGVSASLLAASKDSWGRGWTSGKARDAAMRWFHSVRVARRAGQKMGPDRYLEIFYEDLIRDPAPEIQRIFSFADHPISREEADRIAAEQSFEKQKAIGGTPFKRSGELARKGLKELKEPAGFFRSGKADAWKTELGFLQKLIIWRHTRHLMQECGYDWQGKHSVKAPSPMPDLPAAQPASPVPPGGS